MPRSLKTKKLQHPNLIDNNCGPTSYGQTLERRSSIFEVTYPH